MIDENEIAMSVQWDNYSVGGTIIFNLFVCFLPCLLVVARFTTQQNERMVGNYF